MNIRRIIRLAPVSSGPLWSVVWDLSRLKGNGPISRILRCTFFPPPINLSELGMHLIILVSRHLWPTAVRTRLAFSRDDHEASFKNSCISYTQWHRGQHLLGKHAHWQLRFEKWVRRPGRCIEDILGIAYLIYFASISWKYEPEWYTIKKNWCLSLKVLFK